MKPFDDWPEQMEPADLRECLGIGVNEAFDWFKRPDFPAIDKAKRRHKRVGKYALRAWMNHGEVIT